MATKDPAHVGGIATHMPSLSDRPNTFPHIFRLPSEILEIIFIHGAREHYESSSHYALRMPSWVNVSYVCRRWRNTALTYPSLWTYHFTVSLRWTDALLARSGQAPLKIRAFHRFKSDVFWSAFVEKLMNNLDRIQELDLRLPARLLPKNVSFRAPHLRDFELRADGPHFDQSWILSDGYTPALRTLKLSKCAVPWHLLTLSGLSALSLSCVPPQDMVEFLAVLSHMQDLTTLRLEEALASAHGVLFNGVPNINLPCLVVLSVAAPHSSVVALLSCINFPSKTRVRLDFQSDGDSFIHDYAPISRLLVPILGKSKDLTSPDPLIHFLFIQAASQRLHFRFSTSEHDPDRNTFLPRTYEMRDSNDIVEIILSVNPDSDLGRVVSDLCCSISLADIRTFHLASPPFSSAFWRTILGLLPGLRVLRITDGCMPDLASVLALTNHELAENARGQDAGGGDPTGHAFVPALERMELIDVTFSSDPRFEYAISQASLLDAISTRPLLQDRLSMINCRERGVGFQWEDDSEDYSESDEDESEYDEDWHDGDDLEYDEDESEYDDAESVHEDQLGLDEHELEHENDESGHDEDQLGLGGLESEYEDDGSDCDEDQLGHGGLELGCDENQLGCDGHDSEHDDEPGYDEDDLGEPGCNEDSEPSHDEDEVGCDEDGYQDDSDPYESQDSYCDVSDDDGW